MGCGGAEIAAQPPIGRHRLWIGGELTLRMLAVNVLSNRTHGPVLEVLSKERAGGLLAACQEQRREDRPHMVVGSVSGGLIGTGPAVAVALGRRLARRDDELIDRRQIGRRDTRGHAEQREHREQPKPPHASDESSCHRRRLPSEIAGWLMATK